MCIYLSDLWIWAKQVYIYVMLCTSLLQFSRVRLCLTPRINWMQYSYSWKNALSMCFFYMCFCIVQICLMNCDKQYDSMFHAKNMKECAPISFQFGVLSAGIMPVLDVIPCLNYASVSSRQLDNHHHISLTVLGWHARMASRTIKLDKSPLDFMERKLLCFSFIVYGNVICFMTLTGTRLYLILTNKKQRYAILCHK